MPREEEEKEESAGDDDDAGDAGTEDDGGGSRQNDDEDDDAGRREAGDADADEDADADDEWARTGELAADSGGTREVRLPTPSETCANPRSSRTARRPVSPARTAV